MPDLPRPRPRLAVALSALAVLAGVAGCGGDKGDTANGEQLFTQRCGACHILADAGTKGTIGPNLDKAFQQSVRDGLGRDTIEGVVRDQIALPQGDEMPAKLVTGADANAVAAYVASVAAKSGNGTTGGGGATGGGGQAGGSGKANARGEVEIDADPSGQLKYQVTSATAKAGKVTLLSKNDSPVPHDISIRGNGVDQQGKQVTSGGTSKVSLVLKSGKYEFYCSVPGHEQAGMRGTLTVR